MRKEFEITEEQLNKLLEACRPTPVMYISGGQRMGRTQQENANSAWCALGRELGFDGMTVRPVPDGRGMRFFTAEAIEKQAS